MLENFIVSVYNPQIYLVLWLVYYGLLISLPIILIRETARYWVYWRKLRWHYDRGWTLLEIQLPQEIKKSPQAMEILLEVCHRTGEEQTFIDRWWLGKHRTWFSLELISIDGLVHFFIWTRTPWKEVLKASIYAQYPTVEIFEVEDYTKRVPFDLERYVIWGCEFDLAKDDPYPIKTYKDYGMDKEAKEEFKIDPLSSLVEFLGNLPAGNQIWIQFIIRAHKKEKKVKGSWWKKQTWKEEGQEIIKDIIKKAAPAKKVENKEETPADLSDWQKNTIDAIQRHIDKHAFDTGIRGLYIVEKEVFDPSNISALVSAFKQFSSEEMNGLKPARGLVPFNYPWQDFWDFRQNRVRRNILEAYKLRSYFHLPYRSPAFVLSIEELATLYHFPGEVVTTPTMARLKSRKVEAPADLPH